MEKRRASTVPHGQNRNPLDSHDQLVNSIKEFLRIDIGGLVEKGTLEKRGTWYRIKDDRELPMAFTKFATAVKGNDGDVWYHMNVEEDRRLAYEIFKMLTGRSLE